MTTDVDLEGLTRCIKSCFDLSGDDRLTEAKQRDMLALGKRLRGRLMDLLTAQFNEDIEDNVVEANTKLGDVNKRLEKVAEAIEKIADTVQQVTKLAGLLDRLVKVAIAFH